MIAVTAVASTIGATAESHCGYIPSGRRPNDTCTMDHTSIGASTAALASRRGRGRAREYASAATASTTTITSRSRFTNVSARARSAPSRKASSSSPERGEETSVTIRARVGSAWSRRERNGFQLKPEPDSRGAAAVRADCRKTMVWWGVGGERARALWDRGSAGRRRYCSA